MDDLTKEDQAAFFKWYLSDDVLPRFCDYDSGDVEEVWQAACAYKQKQITDLQNSIEELKSEVAMLDSELVNISEQGYS